MTQAGDDGLALPQMTAFSVEGGGRYIVDVRCLSEEGANEKGVLAQVEFQDARRKPIDVSLEGWRTSEKYGMNRYVAVSDPADEPAVVRLEVAAPEKARIMTLVLSPWDATEARLAEKPSASLDRRLFLSADEPIVREYAIRPRRPYTLSCRAGGYSTEPDRAGMVEVEYLDKEGELIPGPYERLFALESSGGFGQYFESDAPFVLWLDPPSHSRAVRVRFRRAEATRPLTLLGEPNLEEVIVQKVDEKEAFDLPHSIQKQIEGGGNYLIEGLCASEGQPNSRGALLKIEFQNAEGRPLDGMPEGWERSAEMGLHRFLPTEMAGRERNGFSVPVMTPADAHTVTLQFLPWAATARPYLLGVVAMEIDPRIPLSRERAVSFSFPIEGPVPHLLIGSTTSSAPAGERMALVSAEYFDAEDELIPGPYPGFGRSPRPEIGYYQYISGLEEAEHTSFVQWIQPPEGASKAELYLRSWTAPDDLTLDEPPAFGPAGREEVEGLLEIFPDHERLLQTLARLLSVRGELAGHVDVMRTRAAALWTPEARRAYDRAAGTLRELDTKWLPGLAGRREAAGSNDGGRICHLFKVTYPFENTGGAIRNLNTVASQHAAGLDPYVITPLNYPASHGVEEFAEEEEIAGVPHIRLPIRGDEATFPNASRLTYDTQLTASVIEERGVDVIHAASGFRGYELGLKGLALRRHFDKPLVYEIRSLHEHLWGSGRAENVLEQEWTQLRMAQEKRCMLEADTVVTIAKAMRTVLADRGVPEEKIHVVPNAVDESRFVSVPVAKDLRAELGLDGASVVGYVSNVSYREGHDTLVRAFHLLSQDYPNLRCLVVGEGPQRERIEELAAALGVRNRLVTTGEVDHTKIDLYYSLIDIFVVPRRSDYASDYVTPLKPYEALALERPIIVSDRPSLREIVGDEERGLIFRSEDHEHLAARIAELLSADEETRLDMGRRGREWVLSERTWSRNAARYAEIYAEVIERQAFAVGDLQAAPG